MFGYSGLSLVASQAQVKAETQCDRQPRSDAVGRLFLWCWLPALVLEQRQVGIVEEYWPLETQLSNEPELCLHSFGYSL